MGTPSWDDVEVGDTVSFVVTGEVLTIDEAGGAVANESGEIAFIFDSDVLKSVEKPVVTFKPGDVVRWKEDHRAIYTIGAAGKWFDHHSRKWYEGGDDDDPVAFSSEGFELVP